ncbi:hypothetical protein NC653_025890 [Populus alba x Populus x berolinensis]|uniref:Uncharacterized protein n=1 Tax=Populus alba x Populus x berolinensis TaxID=444605 RepID=A0AAD6Q8K7_9ROSI|nr:hypothetical protein NC653_025890 [Populus alba x Populus x berolinensis]
MFLGMASYSETSSDDDEDDMAWFEERLKKKRHRMEDAARAVLKFGEIHGRIESLKQRQMIELEKQRMKEVVIEIAQRPIFSKGSSSVYISMKPSFHLQLKSGSPLPRYPEAVTSSTDEAFKDYYDLPVIFLPVALFCVHHWLLC